ncbi:MAG: hypothetical protein RR651_00945 [Lysinibacillus sp.]
MNMKKILMSTLFSGALLISGLAIGTGEAEAASDKDVGRLTNFTVKYSGWTYHNDPVEKRADSTSSNGSTTIVNLDQETGDAWVDCTIVANGGTVRYSGGMLQRGDRQPFPYTRHALKNTWFKIGVKKTYNTNGGTVTIQAGRWSPDNY